jgi:osmotically-inducible protein OsmY
MKTDSEIQQDVQEEIKWDARITASEIGVSVKDGIVSLNGSTGHYIQKTAAEEAAQRVFGVRAVTNEIKVNFLDFSFNRSDQDIAETAIKALNWTYQVPEGIKISVSDGTITLKGEVEWAYQKEAAKNCVKSLMGVRHVNNEIKLTSHIKPADVKSRIEAALRRSADMESKGIKVAVDGSTVTLSGSVHSMAEKDDARWAAYCAPGITCVNNNLSIHA